MSPSPSRSVVHRGTAGMLILAVVAWFITLPVWVNHARAAPLTNVSDVLSNASPSAPSDHTVTFTTVSGVAEGQTVTVTFPAEFTLTGLTEDDLDIADDSFDLTTAANCGGSEQARATISGQVVTFEVCTGDGGAIAPGSVVTIEVGQHATAHGTGATRATNPTTVGDYEIGVAGTMDDSAETRVFIIEPVVVSGEVATTLTFSVEGIDSGVAINGDGVATMATTTATSMHFGILSSGSARTLGQELFVSTNAKNGFSVTVRASGDFAGSNNAVIDTFVDGTSTSTPALWQAPSADPYDDTTWGHWGVTTEDDSLSDGDSFGVARYAGNFVSTPREVFFHGDIADGSTEHIGTTRVAYKVEISGMQEAASDYQTTLTYVCTPSF